MLEDGFGQCHVRQEIVAAGNESLFVFRFRHQGSPLCDVHKPFVQLVDQCSFWRAERIPDLCTGRNDVGRFAAVSDHVLDAAGGLHMLAQVVRAHIHQLNGIQCAPAVPRIQTRVG